MNTVAIRNMPENKETFSPFQKIVDIEQLVAKINSHRDTEQIVHCHGVFDLLHIGHIKHLQLAKQVGDVLIVTITCDKHVNKGLGKPYFTERLRAEALAALECVDYVYINQDPTAVEIIKKIRPHFYVKGVEYASVENDLTRKITDEEMAVKTVGGKIHFTDDIVFSSSSLLNRFFSPFSSEVLTYLERFKAKFESKDILKYFDKIQSAKVLIIGEAIIDIYHYGEVIGKSGKEPILVSKYNREEMYIGGILAIANHLSSFCAEVNCVSVLGDNGEYEPFIRQNLKPNVNIQFTYKRNSPTIVKRRYLEEYSAQKLFEIYEIDDCYLEEDQRNHFVQQFESEIAKHDVVIVADYGHGLLDAESIKVITDKAKFLAVNTQANASNHGYNCISKYKTADYVCIANRELQLNYRQKHISVLEQMKRLIQEYKYKNVMVTSGVNGSYFSNNQHDIFSIPALTCSVKDRVGAGDAVLAITSLLVAEQAPAEMVGLVGNVVGSEAVNIMGNKSFIEKTPLLKHVLHLLK